MIDTHVVYCNRESWGCPNEVGGFRNENDIFVMQHRVGCRVCGAKSSSRFRAWRSYSHLEGFEGVEFKAPKSDVICNTCSRAADRQTLKVAPPCANSSTLFLSYFRSNPTYLSYSPQRSSAVLHLCTYMYCKIELTYNSETRRSQGQHWRC
jgi:hypothetical protein